MEKLLASNPRHLEGGLRNTRGKDIMSSKYAKQIQINGRNTTLHRIAAENALGKPLPEGAAVHHHNAEQLMICQNNAYHRLLHQRMRAHEACGNSNWRKCKVCKKYDDPKNLYINRDNRDVYHRGCKNNNLKVQVKSIIRKALEASGHPDWRKCNVCKNWDDPINLYINGRTCYHRSCKTNQRKASDRLRAG